LPQKGCNNTNTINGKVKKRSKIKQKERRLMEKGKNGQVKSHTKLIS